jgi:hypothetical protein
MINGCYMKNYSWIYKAIEEYRNSKEQLIRELWKSTEKYFYKNVLPLLDSHVLTEDDRTCILLIGFQNILNHYQSGMSIKPTIGKSMIDVVADVQVAVINASTPLDKANLDIRLFWAFYGFTFLAIKNKELIKDISNKKEKNAMDSWREMNELLQESKFKLSTAENRILLLEGKAKPNKNKAGVKPRYKTETEFHSAIKKLTNWEKLVKNKSALAKKLGYASSSGLNDLLKTNGWELPHGN